MHLSQCCILSSRFYGRQSGTRSLEKYKDNKPWSMEFELDLERPCLISSCGTGSGKTEYDELEEARGPGRHE